MMSNLNNRVIQIAGSCSKNTDVEIIRFSHRLVKLLTKNLIEKKAIIVSKVGKEDRTNPNDPLSPSIVFYWDVLEVVYEYAKLKSFSEETKNLAIIVSSEKAEKQIPENRRDIWQELIKKGTISLHRIKPGWNAGAYIRQEQENLSDALLILGGGEGVEHSAYLHVSNGKLVLPLDIPLGSSYDDGLGGAPYLSRFAITKPEKFIPRINEDTASKLASLSYEIWKNNSKEYANEIIGFFENAVRPQVFYVRLLNNNENEYPLVEHFFRNIVDPIVQKSQYFIRDMGISNIKSPFLNIEIFQELHNSSIIIADITSLRPNCFIEMGFAFGEKKKVLSTAKKGTKLPFDQNAIPCHFWDPSLSIEEQQKSFSEFWIKNIDRLPIISDIDII